MLVPELCGGLPEADDTHLAVQVPPLREAVLAAVRELAGVASRWVVVGVGAVGPGFDDEPGVSGGDGRAPDSEVDAISGSPAAHGAGVAFDAVAIGTVRRPPEPNASRSDGLAFDVEVGGVSGGAPQQGASSGRARAVDGGMGSASAGARAGLDDVRLFDAGTVGTFRGYGVDLRVGLSEAALEGDGAADAGLPLAVLIGGWARGCAGDGVSVDAWVVDEDASGCVQVGERLRRELDADAGTCGVLVIADGAATLSTSAPGYLDPRARAVQDRIDDALSAGDLTVLTTLDTELCAELGVSGRAAYQVLAGLFADDAPKVETLYRAAPFGVGYQVSTWRPGAGS
ncbi:hypothetical protein NRB20_20140 [Nocardia sp. RB20]|uniref:Uncharacterized protein n=1 Tax=Nocardia macrotermitis TaxID=2585198 RepID=A0A7K0CZR7_9NOCA|nr:hypothetical protein [Nocardia macrotermitis]